MTREEATLTLRGLFASWDKDPQEYLKPMLKTYNGKPHLLIDDGLMSAKEVAAVAVLMGYSDSERGQQ